MHPNLTERSPPPDGLDHTYMSHSITASCWPVRDSNQSRTGNVTQKASINLSHNDMGQNLVIRFRRSLSWMAVVARACRRSAASSCASASANARLTCGSMSLSLALRPAISLHIGEAPQQP